MTALTGARDAWPDTGKPCYALAKLEYEFTAPRAARRRAARLMAGDENVYDAAFDGAFAEVIEKDTGKIIGARDCRVSGKIGPSSRARSTLSTSCCSTRILLN